MENLMFTVTATIEPQESDDKSVENAEETSSKEPTPLFFQKQIKDEVAALFGFVDETSTGSKYEPFERELIGRIFKLGRLFIALFLCLAHEQTFVPPTLQRGRSKYKRQRNKSRLLGTFFGKFRYCRDYLHQENGKGGGYYPLDQRLGLSADGFSHGLLSRAVQLATKMSFVAATKIMLSFVGWSPSTKTIEQATLGLGRYTASWFEKSPPPEEDGEVLVAQIDSKATPTARAEELKKRRGKRRKKRRLKSARHRGRVRRYQWAPKRRRKKGDKSKNGKMATIVVMYTLRQGLDEDGTPILEGPINRWVYASYAPKRHAFAVARREADKRGFTAESGKLIQIVTDGDEDLARGVDEFFPEAIHTLDVIHAIEYLWRAGTCLFKEGSDELTEWVERQKERLYSGGIWDIILELESEYVAMRDGSKRRRLNDIINYLGKRVEMMNYDELIAQDLELASGIVEGAVRFVIAQRFDEGGMRWIKERAESLLQLRCIEINGHWEQFIDFVHEKIQEESERLSRPQRLLQDTPNPLPNYGLTL
jgi:hypothetical protein